MCVYFFCFRTSDTIKNHIAHSKCCFSPRFFAPFPSPLFEFLFPLHQFFLFVPCDKLKISSWAYLQNACSLKMPLHHDHFLSAVFFSFVIYSGCAFCYVLNDRKNMLAPQKRPSENGPIKNRITVFEMFNLN